MRLHSAASRLLVVAALALYGLSWTQPVILVPAIFSRTPNAPPTPYYGWHGLNAAFGPVAEPTRPESVQEDVGQVLTVASGASNVLFIVVAALLLFAPTRSVGPRLEAALWLSLPVHLVWLWDTPGELKSGYALWVLSFAVLALATRALRRFARHDGGVLKERTV